MKRVAFVTLLFLLVGFVIGYKSNALSSGDTVSATKLREILRNDRVTLINVHTPYEGEIARTNTFIPYDKIVEFSAFLPKDKRAPIVLYCQTGHMSQQALSIVKKLGYTNVKHLEGGMKAWTRSGGQLHNLSDLPEQVTPKDGIELPFSFGDLPGKLVAAGVLDLLKLKEVVRLTPQQEALFFQNSNNNIRITKENAQFIVDVLWAIGLAQKSLVYTQGPMGQEEKANAGNFASTGGWTLGRQDAMNYYNKLDLIPLTDQQQRAVGEIAKHVYRPCCGNSTWFPDCNHGMAALAAIELMVANDIDEKTIYKALLALNSYWFSETYLTTATFFARQGISWDNVDAKEVLGQLYSSGQGAGVVAKKVGPLPYIQAQGGASCGA